MPLSTKQMRFVDEYMIDMNATAAYQRAGYRAKGHVAESNASRLLSNAEVKEEIARRQAILAEAAKVKVEQVVEEYKAVAFSDIGDILDFTQTEPRFRPANEISAKARRAIQSVKVKRYWEGSGEFAKEVEVIEFRLWPKTEGLAKLGQHLGMFVDKHEITGKDGKDLLPTIIKVVCVPPADSE